MEDPGLKFRQEKKIFLISKSPEQLWGPSSLLLNRDWCPFPYVKREGRAFVHSPLSSAQVKNEWTYISTPSTFFRGLDRENFTFIFPFTDN